MFTEELAREIGVAYGIYKAICSTTGETAMSAENFKTLCCNSVEEIREVAGLVDENSITG